MGYQHSLSHTSKSSKRQLRCFQCRLNCLSKDGNWHQWKDMQVFLCKHCELETRARPERREAK